MAQDSGGYPTEPQVKYARTLGIEFDSKTIRFGELSRLIDAAKQHRPPSAARIDFARNLGIEFDEAITDPELRKLLNAEIARQSKAALRDNPVLKVGETIMYKDHAYEITAIDRKRWRIQLKPCYKGHGRSVAPMIITLKDATHVDITPQRP